MKLSVERVAQAEKIFNAVTDLPAAERRAHLERACGGDVDLIEFVERLLRSDLEGGAPVGEMIARSRRQAAAEALLATDVPMPSRIGPYSIQSVLGQGGMGVVYRAVRDDAFEKTVAIKVVKRGMDTDAVLERFRQERQILASFDHPNIARLLDGGQTEDGRPYLVMDYVEGTELMDFIRERQPSLAQKLELFIAICRAVEYAHRRLVVHRDLKPSNIRVDNNGQPVLLDFGIAKLLDADARMTQTGFPAMTPQYAAPEQVRGEPITVGADVYTLGLLLFEMLTGAKAHRIASMSGPEVYRVVCLDDPPTVAGTAPGLPRDLDAIVAMALRKEPSRRYVSASRLAEDVRRFLDGEAVTARAGSRAYKTGKFLKRHWRVVVPTGLALLAVVAASIALVRFARQAERERQKAEEVSSFLTGIFRVSTPSEAKGNSITAREILDAGAERLARNTSLTPEVKVDLVETVAQVYDALGLFKRAEDMLLQAVALRRGLGSEVNVASTLGALGSVRGEMGQYRSAAELLRESLAIQRRLRPGDKDVARVENDLGVLLYYIDECRESRQLLGNALKYLEANGPRALISTVKNNIGLCSTRLSEYDDAIALFREALAIDRQTGGPRDLGAANDLTNLGVALAHRGRYDEAEAVMTESIAIRRRLLGDSHPELSRSLSNLARALLEVGDLDRAAAAQEEASRIRAHLPRGGLAVTDTYVLGLLDLAQGRWKAARRDLEEAVALGKEFLGEEHHDTLQAMSALSLAMDRVGQHAESRELQARVLEIARRRFGGRHSLVGLAETRMASLQLNDGQVDEALSMAVDAVTVLSDLHGAGHPRVADALMVEGNASLAKGNRGEAQKAFARALTIRRLKLRSTHPGLREAEEVLKPSGLPSEVGGAHGT